jgi:protoporphyrin/coproporphyrin ferrochelatase
MSQRKFKTGVMLVNLGTPDSAATPDVRKYLREFLIDGRVIDIPYIFRWLLVNGIIAPFRAPKSAKIYKELWTDQGSPLKIYGISNESELQKKLGEDYIVKIAMRYQSPSMQSVMDQFYTAGIERLIVVPLFPQYASATTGSVYEEVFRIATKWQIIPEISIVNYFYQKEKFIKAFAENARKYLNAEQFDHIIFSYHGVPERQIRKGDAVGGVCKFGDCCASIRPDNQHCYRAQCFETTRLLVKELGLEEGSYTTCFQSRLGRDPWIQPYSEDTIKALPAKGLKRVLAFSPAFVSDCLETTIEVGEEYKEVFEENGGEHWQLVDSLNDSPLWIELLEELVKEKMPTGV